MLFFFIKMVQIAVNCLSQTLVNHNLLKNSAPINIASEGETQILHMQG